MPAHQRHKTNDPEACYIEHKGTRGKMTIDRNREEFTTQKADVLSDFRTDENRYRTIWKSPSDARPWMS